MKTTGDISAAEFREAGRALVDWIADYLEHPERVSVLAQVAPGEVAERIPVAPPASPESWSAVLEDIDRWIVPGLTHWNHPGFMAYFAISGSYPGILGELLAAAFNVNGMVWRSAPAATELEARVLGWLRQLIGLDGAWFGQILDTASIASLHALAAAREALGVEVGQRGLAGRADLPPLCVYVSDQAHASIEKGAMALGFGSQHVRKIGVDPAFRMQPDALAVAIAADREAGRLPCCVVATVGTTSTAAIDPVNEIAAVCQDEQVWLHVDAAYGGAAALVPEYRHVVAGCERADSFVVNPHKWLFTPIDLSAFYTRHPDILKRTFSLVPAYLQTPQDGDADNLMDYGLALGRRFRALKLWWVIRAFGRSGLVSRLRDHLRLAALFAEWVEEDPSFELAAPPSLSLVCFRAAPESVSPAERNYLNKRVLERVNSSGEVFLSHTELDGQMALRLAIGNIRTTEEHVARAWALVRRALSEVPPLS